MNLKQNIIKDIINAETHFPNCIDKKRIYILYGPPYEIQRYPWMSVFDSGMNYGSIESSPKVIKSLHIWSYNQPAGTNRVPEIFKNINPRMKKFVFADLTGIGLFEQIFSTEEGELVRPFIYDYGTE